MRRLLALASIYDGVTRLEAASVGGVTVQIVRDWVGKLNTGGPEVLVDYKGPGPQPILTDAHRTALAQPLEDGPIPAIHGVVRWRVIDLVRWLSDKFHMSVSKQLLSQELRHMGYGRLSARPRHHAQAAGDIEAFENVFPRVWTLSGARRVLPPIGVLVDNRTSSEHTAACP